MVSRTRQGVRFGTGIRLCSLVMARALGFASCDSIHKTGGAICYGYWVLHLVISRTRQGVRFVTAHTRQGYNLSQASAASCDITYTTRGAICYGHWALYLGLAYTRQGVRFVTGIGLCIL